MPETHSVLIDAIQSRLQVTFRYRRSEETEGTERVVEPWIYGIRNGKKCLYGFSVSGGKGQGLRRFNLEKVKSMNLTGDHISNHPSDVNDVTKWDEIFAQWDHKVSV
jgi:predicted DNA-binding transcriptional regulator YafY